MMSPLRRDSSGDYGPEIHHHVSKAREARPTTLRARFQGIPNDRMEMISRALSKAGTSYIEETSNSPNSAVFFEHTIDRALLPLLDPDSASRSRRRSFSYEDLEESDLPELLRNMKLVIATQREEIECLRVTIRELVLEISDRDTHHLAMPAQKVPEMVHVEESSSDSSIDQGIFRRLQSTSPSHLAREVNEDDGYSHLILSIVRSRSNLTDDSHHIEPEGTYIPQQNMIEAAEMRRKMDPPTENDDESWDDSEGDVREKLGDMNHFGNAVDDEDVDYEYGDGARLRTTAIEGQSGPSKMSSRRFTASRDEIGNNDVAQVSSNPSMATPARERAKNIVQERRRRYQNFRRKAGNRELQNGTTLQANPSLPSSYTKTEDAMSAAASASTTSKAVSSIVRFREDELTLMDTTRKKNDQ
jgi:hypothetical protein